MTNELTGEAKHRELYARSQDELRVRNPRLKDNFVRFDGRAFRIPGKNIDMGHGKGEAVYPRYIAEKFMREFAVSEINSDQARVKGGLDKKFEGTDVFIPAKEEAQAPRTDNAELLKKYMAQCFVRVERKFGMDEVPDEFQAPKKDPTDLAQSLIDEIEKESFINAISEDES